VSDNDPSKLLVVAVAELMRRINDNHEILLAKLRDLDTRMDSTRALVMGLPAAVLKAVEDPLLRRIAAVEERVSKIEGDH
jgi:hypothetical protein